MIKFRVIHPLFFAAYPALFLFAKHPAEFQTSQLVWALLILLLGTSLLWAGAWFLLRNLEKSGLVVSLLVFLLFNYGFARGVLPAEWGAWSVLAWLMAWALGVAVVLRANRSTPVLNLFANVVGLALVGLCVVSVVLFESEVAGEVERAKKIDGALPQGSAARDIYVIVVDAYARADILRDLYGFDNSPFLGALRGRGFYVANESISNHMQTAFSLSACLDADYLNGFAELVGTETSSHLAIRQKLRTSRVPRFLREQGYTYVAFESGQRDSEMPYADNYIRSGQSMDSFLLGLINMTPAPEVIAGEFFERSFDTFRNRIRFIFDQLGKVERSGESPLFVMAHIESPHPPFIFGPQGEPRYPGPVFHDLDGNYLIRPGGITKEVYRQAYAEQLMFVSRTVLASIDEILARPGPAPIILLFGDHGPRMGLFWADAEATDQREALSNLTALYLPDGGDAKLYPGISPVNFFRVILSHYFDADLPLLEDRSYFSSQQHPYRFIDVTDRVRASVGP
jgi:hypothetical protein